ncbi:MAG: MarR family transcriptional regulator, partial [Sphingomonadaceae bacterium]|nr:MarR family transcriptional regulator [Sphingomonadaceae bacterium]
MRTLLLAGLAGSIAMLPMTAAGAQNEAGASSSGAGAAIATGAQRMSRGGGATGVRWSGD